MLRYVLIILLLALWASGASGQPGHTVIVDSVTRMPLPSASVFDSGGKAICVSDSKGRLPYISPDRYPATVRYMGYGDGAVANSGVDTVFLQPYLLELPEVVVSSRQQKVMHVLAYVREYSTLSTYTDTVFLFREKMVDYMLTPDSRTRFNGWSTPRIIKARSYYRFTDAYGLDSVSDNCGYHFSWSDWMGLVSPPAMPRALRSVVAGSDTVYGRYSATQIWTRNADKVNIDVDVLADTASRVWVPGVKVFFRKNLEFENFRVRYSFDNVTGDTIDAGDITGYSFHIESTGRGHDMHRFGRAGEPFYVTTYAEVYILDKEFITVKEARKWASHKFHADDIAICRPPDAPVIQQSVNDLIARVESVDQDKVRLDVVPDDRLASGDLINDNYRFGRRVLSMLKQLTGITLYKSHKNFNRNWDNFKQRTRDKQKSQNIE